MSLLNEIIDGWSSYLSTDKVANEIAVERAKICANCKDEDGNNIAVKGKFIEFLKDDIKEIEGLKCDLCQCPLSAKTRSKNSKCPLKKW